MEAGAPLGVPAFSLSAGLVYVNPLYPRVDATQHTVRNRPRQFRHLLRVDVHFSLRAEQHDGVAGFQLRATGYVDGRWDFDRLSAPGA